VTTKTNFFCRYTCGLPCHVIVSFLLHPTVFSGAIATFFISKHPALAVVLTSALLSQLFLSSSRPYSKHPNWHQFWDSAFSYGAPYPFVRRWSSLFLGVCRSFAIGMNCHGDMQVLGGETQSSATLFLFTSRLSLPPSQICLVSEFSATVFGRLLSLAL